MIYTILRTIYRTGFIFSTVSLLPLTAQAYDLPLRANDLKIGELYSTFVHKGGIQAEGKDIGARRRVSDSNWPALKADSADAKVLSNWIVYGKPFYAMAAGTVVGCWRNAPENVPGNKDVYEKAKKFAGGGNHLWILQDDGVYALYAHAQPGSIPASICPHNAELFTGTNGTGIGHSPDIEREAKVTNGARVKAGQFLGKAGNSGSSDGPHLHVHMEKDGKPVVMKFAQGMTTPFTGGKAKFSGPWTKLAGNKMPDAEILFWPRHNVGNYTFNGTPGKEYQGLFDHMADSGMMPNLITCKSNGATYNATWIPSQGKWLSFHGMSASEAAAKHTQLTGQGFKRTSSYTCGSVSVAVWRK
jgi:hypothetical protein